MECYVDYKIILSISVQVQSFIYDPTDPTLYVELLFLKEDTRHPHCHYYPQSKNYHAQKRRIIIIIIYIEHVMPLIYKIKQ